MLRGMTQQTSFGSRSIACIGAGAWGRNHVRNLHELGVLRMVCESEPATRDRMIAEYPDVRVVDSVEAVVADPEVRGVVIATPAQTHAQLTKQCLLAGRHVLVEKPLCLSVGEGRELVELARRERLVLMVGHLLWYHPGILKLKELVDGGELGRIRYIYSNRLNFGKIRREENILWSFAPHDISVILGLLGELPNHVEASGGRYLHNQIADVTISLLSFPSGVKGHIFVSWLHPFKEQKLVIVGERKMALFDDLEPVDKLVLYPHSIDWKDQIPIANKAEATPVEIEWAEPLRRECEHFLECIRTGARPRTDGEEGLRVLTVLQACERALGDAPRSEPVSPGPPYFVHESSVVDEGVTIGDDTKIWHFSHVLRGSRIGKSCRIGQNVVIGPDVAIGDSVKIQNNVSVYEGVTLEDHVFCGPSIVFTNVYNPRSEIARMSELRPTLVKRGATLGANATIVCGVTIGAYAFVGAGAVVTRDVPDFGLVYGNPGKLQGWMCRCGTRLRFAGRGARRRATCRACDERYLEQSGVVRSE
jgi:UDP-2-acetamido-3-amino-2,3-dideoxy-glucuronate N-acetyltransferase